MRGCFFSSRHTGAGGGGGRRKGGQFADLSTGTGSGVVRDARRYGGEHTRARHTTHNQRCCCCCCFSSSLFFFSLRILYNSVSSVNAVNLSGKTHTRAPYHPSLGHADETGTTTMTREERETLSATLRRADYLRLEKSRAADDVGRIDTRRLYKHALAAVCTRIYTPGVGYGTVH